jgi:hypothetical protein
MMAALAVSVFACQDDDDDKDNNTNQNPIPSNPVEFKSYSRIGNYLKLDPAFSDVQISVLHSSGDTLEQSPNFVYGSMADGAGLLKNNDGTFTLINNIEADYSIARITLDKTFKPVKGEYILNSTATASTAQCSGSLITPEEHGFGPLYLSGGEWGGQSKGVFQTDPFKSASSASAANMLTAMGQWSTENAVVIGKDAYPNQTVVFIGDDHSDNNEPSGQLGMYVGNRGDLSGGKLYCLKVTSPGIDYEVDMQEGVEYDMEFVQMNETDIDLLDAEAKAAGVMGFSRLEDIDWRRGSAENQREIYFAVTGRSKAGLVGKGTKFGRIYKVELNDNDPTAAGKITCVLDGDIETGIAGAFHSPDNILVTENYAYIQEDPNGYASEKASADHFARLYQYDLNTGVLKTVLECDQNAAAADGIGTTSSTWELTGMIDISEVVGVNESFILVTQNHGWEDPGFTDPNANPDLANRTEGSQLFVLKGLGR